MEEGDNFLPGLPEIGRDGFSFGNVKLTIFQKSWNDCFPCDNMVIWDKDGLMGESLFPDVISFFVNKSPFS